MKPLSTDDICQYVELHIGKFHAKRLERLQSLDFRDVLKRKNPYLFKAKYINTASELVRGLLDAHLQSQEETLFGDFMEGIAIFVCGQVYGGFKSSQFEGIDLEFETVDAYYIVEIKSGPNWGNSSQQKKMQQNFAAARAVLSGLYPNKTIIAVNGCCYGIDRKPDKGTYFKYCGQLFWELISGDATLYTSIVEPLAHQAKEQNESFQLEYSRVINKFTAEFIADFCDDGAINWTRFVEFNSKHSH